MRIVDTRRHRPGDGAQPIPFGTRLQHGQQVRLFGSVSGQPQHRELRRADQRGQYLPDHARGGQGDGRPQQPFGRQPLGAPRLQLQPPPEGFLRLDTVRYLFQREQYVVALCASVDGLQGACLRPVAEQRLSGRHRHPAAARRPLVDPRHAARPLSRRHLSRLCQRPLGGRPAERQRLRLCQREGHLPVVRRGRPAPLRFAQLQDPAADGGREPRTPNRCAHRRLRGGGRTCDRHREGAPQGARIP